MSGEVVGWAMKQITGSPAAKLVLAKLADNANEQGLCWPSIKLIVEHTELGQATVYKHLATLEQLGLIEPVDVSVRGEPKKGFQLAVPGSKATIPPRGKQKQVENSIPPGGKEPLPAGKSVPPAGMPYKEEPSIEPSGNRHSFAAGAASETNAPLKESEPHRFEEFRQAIDETWPGRFPNRDEGNTRQRFERLTQRVAADVLIGCARAHGLELTEAKRRRGEGLGPMAVKLPSNWLKEGGWEGYKRAQAEAEQAEAELTGKLARVQSALGNGLFVILRDRLNMNPHQIAALDGLSYEAGPPPVLAGTSVHRIVLERHMYALQRAIGQEVEFVVTAAHGRRSA